MNRVIKAFKFAIIVCVSINLFGLFIAISISDITTVIEDSKRVLPISMSGLFIPCFLSVLFYRKDILNLGFKGVKYVLFPALISFVAIYLIVYFWLSYIMNYDQPFFNIPSLFNGVLSAIVTIFSTLIFYLINVKREKERTSIKINPSITKVLLIFFFGFIAIYLLVCFFGNSSWTSLSVISKFFSYGLLVTFFSYFLFQYIFKKGKNGYAVVLIYIVNIIIVPFLLAGILSNLSLELFLKMIKINLITIGPYFLMLTLAIHTYFISLINKQEKQELKQIGVTASLKYQQLKTQLSPHFLFNNISVLTSLIEEDQNRAVQFSENLSKIYRYFLDQEKQDVVSLKEELAFANEYLSLLKVRFENAIIFINKIDYTNNLYILPLALQQVFENIIKHNEVSQERPITIELLLEKDYLVVTNNLNPKATGENSTKKGLENIRNRYAYFTDRRVVIIKDASHYSIKLPLLKTED